MGLRRTVFLYNWTVLLAVSAALNAAVRFFAHSLVGRLSGLLMPRHGVTPRLAQELVSTGPGRPRQSILPPTAARPKPCECCTPLAVRGPKNGAPSPARFADHPTFSHPTFDSKHEILSILPDGQRFTPRLQKPLGRPLRPVLGRTPLRRHPHSRPDLLAESGVLFQGRQEAGKFAARQRTRQVAFA